MAKLRARGGSTSPNPTRSCRTPFPIMAHCPSTGGCTLPRAARHPNERPRPRVDVVTLCRGSAPNDPPRSHH
eukprot:2637501-Alexandrium_andersonii.AAC.1